MAFYKLLRYVIFLPLFHRDASPETFLLLRPILTRSHHIFYSYITWMEPWMEAQTGAS